MKVATFYRKRWMNIFPLFYLTYFVIYIIFASRAKNLLYGGNPVQLLLTFIGCDAYFGSPYYLTGEWFLGAIIILYLLFPLLKLLMDKCRWITSAGLLILYFLNIEYMILGENTFRSITTCMVSFWIGMLVANELEYIARNALIFVVSIDVFWHLYTGKIALGPETWSVLTGVAVFFILLTSGQYAMTNKYVSMAAKYLSKISFQIFLVHHFIINELASFMQRFTLPNSEIVRWSLFAVILLMVIVVASLLDYVVSLLVRRVSTHRFAQSA